MAWTWDDLKKCVQAGEQFVEGNLEHEAILVARWLHLERASNEPADTTPPSPALTPEADPLLTTETPAG
jgi:hypothetical protein